MIPFKIQRQSPSTKGKRRCKMRWFYSKGAFLVLVWVFLSTTTVAMTIRTAQMLTFNNKYPGWFIALPISIGILTVLPLGWLANTKFGVYNVLKFGHILLFLTTFIICAYTLLLDFDFPKNHQYICAGILFCLIGSFYIIGMAAFIVSVLQLGLDQMPDASSSNITSFNAWLLFSIYAGIWVSDILYGGNWACQKHTDTILVQLWSLIPVSCMSIVIVTDILLAKKWLIIEPKTSKTLKTAYQILKFAAKHKAPLNRSALTYWEENIPSRMDLGKSRYGGPFTTEQVENVKIVLRLLVLSLPLWVLCCSVVYAPISELSVKGIVFPNSTGCNFYALYACTYKSIWWTLITIVLFEFVIYPILRDRLPSILKRIGIVAFSNFILSVLFLILSLVNLFSEGHDDERISGAMAALIVLIGISRGIQICFLLCAMIELVCAQAPYSTRGFFTGYFTVCMLVSQGMGFFLSGDGPLKNLIYTDYNSTILFGAKSCMSLFVLVFYCLLARWYKRRVRDEEYDVHRGVEEVYDRYLSPRVGK